MSRALRRRFGSGAVGFLRVQGVGKSHFGRLLKAYPETRAEIGGRRAFLESDIFDQMAKRAAALDPNVTVPSKSRPGYMPPWHDVDYFGYAAARALLPKGPVENVILVPFGKLGGADYVAGILAGTLVERGRTVILRTDQPDWDRPDWYPEDVSAIDLSGALSGMGDRARALFTLLRVLAPQAVWNVNSRLGFDCFATYGQRLSDSHRLYAYYFCADRTPQGQETGYPVWYMADILPHLHAALVDTRSLADSLTLRYAMPPALSGKIHTVHTPAQRPADGSPLVTAQIDSATGRARPRILWAGRLDQQKRFDILEKVARAMPDVDFVAWGKAVLGKPPSVRKLPKNLMLNPPFGSYEELPLRDCDGWLYTAAWDGLPTILIECGAMGMPIVASAVGGVPELIDNMTGWPVQDAGDPEAYVTALRAMLTDPEARRRRATALQARVRARHSPENFRAALERIR
jgi:glycosyltransferase involved in cell wall biosynthesis